MKPLYLAAATAVAAFISTAASAATFTIDFEEFSDGDLVNGVTIAESTVFEVGVDIAAEGNSDGSPDEARAYDTTNLSGFDPDLSAPYTGPVSDPGIVLIVQAPGNDIPNDDGRGGVITFTFERMVTFLGFDAFDDIRNLVVTGFDADGQVATTSLSIGSDNESDQVSGLSWDVTSLTFDFGGASGAIDNLVFDVQPVPLPAGAPLLLAGLGAMAWLRRRKP